MPKFSDRRWRSDLRRRSGDWHWHLRQCAEAIEKQLGARRCGTSSARQSLLRARITEHARGRVSISRFL
jgi:hypothetical protein